MKTPGRRQAALHRSLASEALEWGFLPLAKG
jgi:hypothetical protein